MLERGSVRSSQLAGEHLLYNILLVKPGGRLALLEKCANSQIAPGVDPRLLKKVVGREAGGALFWGGAVSGLPD